MPTLPERLRSVMVEEYKPLAMELRRRKPLQTRFLVDNGKVTDHHAIIPTEEQVDLWRLSGPERNIYDLVVRRFLAVLLPPFEYEEIRLTLTAGGETFTARGKLVKNQGWKAAYARFDLEAEEEGDEDEREQSLPELKQGDRVDITSAKVGTGRTAPPGRYTEATLLSAMEHPGAQVGDKEQSRILEETGGLGTPATRADIIEKLFSAFYVERRGKELVPTSKGIQVVGLAPSELRSAALTARWEKRLGDIARGKEGEKGFVDEMRDFASRMVAQVKASDETYRHDNVSREKCPDCGKFLLNVQGKRGKMLVCPDRECGYRRSVTQTTNARCPNCHKKMELRGDGEKQIFACVCGYREKLSDFKKRRATRSAGKGDVRRYLQQQEQREEQGNSAMAEQLKKWLEQNKG